MARLPEKLPRWAHTVYRGDAIAWEEAKRQCREVLYGWASAREAHTYGELASRVTAIDWPQGPHTDEGNQIGYLLGQVALEELRRDEDRPLISALVVDHEQNMPSGGFWSLCRELGVGVGAGHHQRMSFWLQELRRCFDVYGGGPPSGAGAGKS